MNLFWCNQSLIFYESALRPGKRKHLHRLKSWISFKTWQQGYLVNLSVPMVHSYLIFFWEQVNDHLNLPAIIIWKDPKSYCHHRCSNRQQARKHRKKCFGKQNFSCFEKVYDQSITIPFVVNLLKHCFSYLLEVFFHLKRSSHLFLTNLRAQLSLQLFIHFHSFHFHSDRSNSYPSA